MFKKQKIFLLTGGIKMKFLRNLLFISMCVFITQTARSGVVLCRVTTVYETCPSGGSLHLGSGTNLTCSCNGVQQGTQCIIQEFFHGSCPASVSAENCECQYYENQPTEDVAILDPNTGNDTGYNSCKWLGCTACEEAAQWRYWATGYEYRELGQCEQTDPCEDRTGACVDIVREYRCADGYCGETSDGKTGCKATRYTKINTNCFITSTFEGGCPDGVTNCKCEETGKNEVLCSTDDFFATLPSWASDYNYICGENIWEDVTIGYQRNQVFESKLGSCLSYSLSYRCANSYYGAPRNTTSGCTPCPEPGISYTPDNKTITMCFVSPKETLSDETGTYSFTTNCYYSE